MTSMVCDGCWTQGDARHACEGVVQRPGVYLTCTCKVDRSCASWSSGDETRSRWERN